MDCFELHAPSILTSSPSYYQISVDQFLYPGSPYPIHGSVYVSFLVWYLLIIVKVIEYNGTSFIIALYTLILRFFGILIALKHRRMVFLRLLNAGIFLIVGRSLKLFSEVTFLQRRFFSVFVGFLPYYYYYYVSDSPFLKVLL